MEEELSKFLSRYLGQGELKKDYVQQDDIGMLVFAAVDYGIEQEIIDYGTEHPDEPFWNLLLLLDGHTGPHSMTQEEIDAEPDEED